MGRVVVRDIPLHCRLLELHMLDIKNTRVPNKDRQKKKCVAVRAKQDKTTVVHTNQQLECV